MYKVQLVFFILTFHAQTQAYRTFSSESGLDSYCQYKKHHIVNPQSTCCKMGAVSAGINLETHWNDCAGSPSSGNNAQTAALGVYSCILKAFNGGDGSISLTKFAELMTEKYPDEVKAKIVEEAGTLDVKADLSDLTSIDKLRVTYFDIEREVCSDSGIKEYGKGRSCSTWEEENHRGGKCCGGSSFPFDMGYKSPMENDFTHKVDSCKKQLEKVYPNDGLTDMMLVNLAEICDISCELIEGQQLDYRELNSTAYNATNFFESHARKLLPSWLPDKIKNDAVMYAVGRFNISGTIHTMKHYEFADAINGNSSTERTVHFAGLSKFDTNTTGLQYNSTEFARRRFPNDVIPTAVLCSAHKELTIYMEIYLHMENCLPPPKESDAEPPADNKEAEGDKSEGETATEKPAEGAPASTDSTAE